MKGSGALISAAFALCLSGARAGGAVDPGAPVAAAAEPAIQLPPMIVEETIGTTKWLYAQVGREEYLSRCSRLATESFIAARERQRRATRAIVPDAFLAALPAITLLYDAARKPEIDDRVARDALGSATTGASSGPNARIMFLGNLRIDDRDRLATCAFIDDVDFSNRELKISSDFLRLHLERRVPMLPAWLIDGLVALHTDLVTQSDSVSLRPLTWLSPEESRALARDPLRPRALLPADELFGPGEPPGADNSPAVKARTRALQLGLFVRWALDPRHHAREPFWRFARQSAEEPTTEALFFRCFGFGFSDLRDRLSDYLPLAVTEELKLELGDDAAPPFEVRVAKSAEVTRLLGEWQRLEVSYVQRHYPQFTPHYLERARRTFARAYGTDDAELLATKGLCELDVGNTQSGVELLNRAIGLGTARPRVFFEVARQRFEQWLRTHQAPQPISAPEAAAMLGLLRRGIALAPPLPEEFGLLADICLRTDASPPDVELLIHGARDFALDGGVNYRIACALARAGRIDDALTLLRRAADCARDESERTRALALLAALSKDRSKGSSTR